MHEIISSGSHGNAVIYHNSILVDCGVPFSKIEPYLSSIQIVLLTHKHTDHLLLSTLMKMQGERPGIRIATGRHLEPFMALLKNVDYIEPGELYNYGYFSIMPVKLYHDVPNFGYRIFKDETKIFHATDTAHLNGIEAKGYDLYAIEHNYDADKIDEIIEDKKSRGEFTHESGSINSHLSEQQASEFIYKNRKPGSGILRLHESKTVRI